MSKPFHPNAFRPQSNPADLSRLPAHLRQSFQDPVPIRDTEFHVRISTYTKFPVTVPDARLLPLLSGEEDGDAETVMLKVLDSAGKNPIALVQISKESLPNLLETLTRIHIASGGSTESLLEILQGSRNTP